jgi:hypothetical protein
VRNEQSRLGFDLDWESISTDANLEVAIAGQSGRWRVDPPTTRSGSACSGIRDHQSEARQGRRRSGDRDDRLADVPHARVLSLLLLLLLPLCLAGDDQTCAIRSRYGNEQEARKSESGLIAHSGVGNSRSGSSTFHSLGISPSPTWDPDDADDQGP